MVDLDNSMDLSPDLYWRQINGLTVDDQQDVFQLLVRFKANLNFNRN